MPPGQPLQNGGKPRLLVSALRTSSESDRQPALVVAGVEGLPHPLSHELCRGILRRSHVAEGELLRGCLQSEAER
jgi:hypothetical protein